MTVLTSFLRLPGSDKRLLLYTLFLIVKVRLMLWVLPFTRIQRSFTKFESVRSDIPVSRLTWSVRMTSRYVPGATCLTKALTGYLLLSKHGYHSMIKIGVGKSAEGEFEAHAWLEYDCEVVLGESEKDLDLFESNDIRVIPYKGPLLSIQSYMEILHSANLVIWIFSSKDRIFLRLKNC